MAEEGHTTAGKAERAGEGEREGGEAAAAAVGEEKPRQSLELSWADLVVGVYGPFDLLLLLLLVVVVYVRCCLSPLPLYVCRLRCICIVCLCCLRSTGVSGPYVREREGGREDGMELTWNPFNMMTWCMLTT